MVTRYVKIPFKRGSTAQNDAYTGAPGEVTIDSVKRTLRVHDGAQAGGSELARVADLAGFQPTIAAGTAAQYWRGDKTWQTLDKTAVGLGNVDNTSDMSKPVSTATQTALNAKEATIAAGSTAQYWRGDKTWQTLNKTAVGLGNVDNTSDANKPISSATQAALDSKASVASLSAHTEDTNNPHNVTKAQIGIPSITDDGSTISMGNALKALVVASMVNFATVTGAATAGTPQFDFTGTDATVNGAIVTKGGNLSIKTGASLEQLHIAHTANAVNHPWVSGTVAGGLVSLRAVGADTDVGMYIVTSGAGSIRFQTGGAGATAASSVEQFRIAHVANAINLLQFSGSATGSPTGYYTSGTDINVGVNYRAKGTGEHTFFNAGGSNTLFRVGNAASSVNYGQAAGGATAASPSLVAKGSDTDIGFNISSKGAYSVDVFTNDLGARQFRISNTTNAANYAQVTGGIAGTGVTLSAQGSDANIALRLNGKGSSNVEIGYPGLTLAGNTSGNEGGQINLSGATGYDSAAIDNFEGYTRIFNASGDDHRYSIEFRGDYVRFRLGGTASTYTDQSRIVHTANTTNYGQITGGAAGGNPSFSVQGSDVDIAYNLTSKGGRNVNFYTSDFAVRQSAIVHVASAVNYSALRGGVAGGYVRIDAEGADTNIPALLTSKGSGNADIWTNSGNQLGLRVAHTASAVNFVQAAGGATSGPVVYSAQGSDTNVGTYFNTKGSGGHVFATSGGATAQLVVIHAASAVNYQQITGSTTGIRPLLSMQGTDANVGVNITAKGTGDFIATGGNAAYTLFKAANVASAVNYIETSPAAASGGVFLRAAGADTSVRLNIESRGTEGVFLRTSSGGIQLAAVNTTSAVNYTMVSGGTTGNGPYLTTTGADTNIAMAYGTVGAADHIFRTGSFSSNAQFRIAHVASAVNYGQITGGATGVGVMLSAQGSDATVDLYLQPKGAAGRARLRDSTGVTHICTGGVVASSDVFLQVQRDIGFVNLSAESASSNGDVRITPKGSGIFDVVSHSIRIRNTQTPASATASGVQGQMVWDINYIYVCTAANTWKRAALSSW